jgi:hypothetical protein
VLFSASICYFPNFIVSSNTHPDDLCGLPLASRQALVPTVIPTRTLGPAQVAHDKVDAVVATAVVGVAVANRPVTVHLELGAFHKVVWRVSNNTRCVDVLVRIF